MLLEEASNFVTRWMDQLLHRLPELMHAKILGRCQYFHGQDGYPCLPVSVSSFCTLDSKALNLRECLFPRLRQTRHSRYFKLKLVWASDRFARWNEMTVPATAKAAPMRVPATKETISELDQPF